MIVKSSISSTKPIASDSNIDEAFKSMQVVLYEIFLAQTGPGFSKF